MVLSDGTIFSMLENGTLKISPMEWDQVQPASVDIRLGNTFSIVEDSPTGIITLDKEIRYKTIESDTYVLLPNQFVLATTMEYFELPNDLTAFVEGRSSLGRMGLFIQNAGWVDPGFKGEITLELYNVNRCAIELKAGRRVGQLVFSRMDAMALNPYNGKYQGQKLFWTKKYRLITCCWCCWEPGSKNSIKFHHSLNQSLFYSILPSFSF